MPDQSPPDAARAALTLHIPLPHGLRFASRTARLAFAAVTFVALVAGVSEGTLAAQRAEAPRRASVAPAVAAPTVVLVMRHAERAAEPGPDPALSAAGAERAQRLAEAARDAKVSAVIGTQFRRTRETAAPLAQAAGVPVTERPITPANAATYAADLARDIREQHAGRTVAVIGHSNTVPAIVAALGGGAPPTLGESDYGDAFVIVLPADGSAARVLRLRVGA
jgi:phosphohistidine phosphatase SixA